MSRVRHRLRRKVKKDRGCQSHLKIEQLEQRRVLSVSSPSAMLSLDALQIDPEHYDDTSIIVRFHEALHNGVTTTPFNSGPSVLNGTQARSQLGDVAGLHRVGLSENISVEEALTVYRQDPRVAYAEPNYRIRIADTTPSDTRYGEMWPLDNVGQTGGRVDADIDAPRAWDVTHGSGSTVVAVIDTGVDYTHPDLAANMWINPNEIPGDGLDNDNNGYVDDVQGYDFVNRDGDPMDDQGHGTHVAGTIGADGDNGLGISGINWDVQIMALKILDASGWGEQSDAIEAIQYAIDNGANITNASWGGDPYSQALYDVIASGRDVDHIFVAAAGNGNELGIGQNNDAVPYYPASYNLDNIVTVSATDDSDRLGGFSNYGYTTVDLAAPGVDILSTVPGGGYGLNSGTSMAAPHATGVLALVQDLHPDWSYLQVIEQVLESVDVLPELYGLNATAGRLNAAAAVGNPEPPPPAPTPGEFPLLDDFQDGTADYLLAQVGSWEVSNGRYSATPMVENNDLAVVSTFNLSHTLPDNFEVETTIRADEGQLAFFGWVLKNHLTNGFVIFDYDSPEDFKFAGPDMAEERWVIGHRDANGWTVDAWIGETLDAATNYPIRVTVQNGTDVQLEAGGIYKIRHNYSETVVDGALGLGSRDSSTDFDNLRVGAIAPDTVGPQLLDNDHSAAFSPPVSLLRIAFNEPVDADTFTTDDITSFVGPNGAISITSVIPVVGSGSREFDIRFPTQSGLGSYALALGPDISDLSGNLMNQDGDDLNGEATEDGSVITFRIVPFAARFDFGQDSTPVATGYSGVTETQLYSAVTGYGWQQEVAGWDRGTDDSLRRDFHFATGGTFLVDLPNGEYEVILTMGDEGGLHDQMDVTLEGVSVDVLTTQAGEYVTKTYLTYVIDGQLMLQLTDLGGSNANVVINALEVISTGPDLTGPELMTMGPSGSFFGTLETFELTFSEPIDAASFSTEDITLIGPAGAISPLSITQLANDQFQASFIPQIALGTYQLAVGPHVADTMGNQMTAISLVDIELITPPNLAMRFDFGKASTPIATGYTGVIENSLYSVASGFGWQEEVSSWDRASSDPLLRDFNFAADGTFLVDLPNGQYEVVLTMGDDDGLHDQMNVTLEGANVDNVTTQAGEYATNSYLIYVTDGQLDLRLTDVGGSNANFVINALEVLATGPDLSGPELVATSPADSLFGSLETIELSFSEAIDVASFTTDDLTLIGPSGEIGPLSLTRLAEEQFLVAFASQVDLGTYQLVVGPQITDAEGNQMAFAEVVNIELETPADIAARFDFGQTSTPVASNFVGVTETDLYNATSGYGWQQEVSSWDRGTSDDLLRDFHFAGSGTFLVDLPSGQYEVVLTMGDEGGLHDQMNVAIEGIDVGTVTTLAGQYVTNSYLVSVTDGQLTLQMTDLGGSNANFVINGLEVLATGPDLSGPEVVTTSPADSFFGSLEVFELTFSEPIDAASLSADDVTLIGPGGTALPLNITQTSGDRYLVTFEPQLELGSYQLAIGPQIADEAGNEMTSAAVAYIELESPPDLAMQFDFGKASTPVTAGYTGVAEDDLYNISSGFGWQKAVSSWDRSISDPLLRDFNFAASGTFLVDLPNGQYEVVLIMGDEGGMHDQMNVTLEGTSVDDVTTQAGEYATNSYLTYVTDGQLTLQLTDMGGSNGNIVINALEVLATGPDLTGPDLVETSPSGSMFGLLESVELTFSELIDTASFTTDDLSLSGPGGLITPLNLTQLADNQFEVGFAPQSDLGLYQLVVGPQIADVAGNQMLAATVVNIALEAPPVISLRFDFGKASTGVAVDYTRVVEDDLYNIASGYGWQQGVSSWDRRTGDALLSDFHYAPTGSFLVDLPNGEYEVVLTMGDEGGLHDEMNVILEGIGVDTVTTQAGEYAVNSYVTNVTDGQLTLQLTDLGGSNANFVVNALEISTKTGMTALSAPLNLVPSLTSQQDAMLLAASSATSTTDSTATFERATGGELLNQGAAAIGLYAPNEIGRTDLRRRYFAELSDDEVQQQWQEVDWLDALAQEHLAVGRRRAQ